MNVNVLIDSIVRQTTVLVAQLATTAGTRATLAHTANQVFMDLVRELKEQGLGNKVIADMFGLALRTYHHKVQRLSESATVRGASLWGAVLGWIQERGTVTRSEVLQRFRYDDERLVRGVLADLVDSGVVFRTGRGDRAAYRVLAQEDARAEIDDGQERLANLIWVAVHRFGPIGRSALEELIPAERRAFEAALEALLRDRRVVARAGADGTEYQCETCVIAVGNAAGWEASVFDHYQAVVTAICAKLRSGADRARPSDRVGGSTYHYDVWEGHPHYAEVAGFLETVRGLAVELRRKVEGYNATHPRPTEDEAERFIAYVGQTVVANEVESEEA